MDDEKEDKKDKEEIPTWARNLLDGMKKVEDCLSRPSSPETKPEKKQEETKQEEPLSVPVPPEPKPKPEPEPEPEQEPKQPKKRHGLDWFL